MRKQVRALQGLSSCLNQDVKSRLRSQIPTISSRSLHITTPPVGTSPSFDPLPQDSVDSPDARFEVLGAPYSLMSASLTASQTLYTRRGTLVGVTGKAENVISTLSILEPFRRAVLGIPFFYQKITSASPINALISTKSPITSFAVVHLDGTLDWMIAQRNALLAWTGQTLSIKPTTNSHMSISHWGNSQVTGRGLLALVGKGQIYQISLKDGEEYVAHPSNIVAYTLSRHMPSPYRFKSSVLRLQVPGVSRFLPNIGFVNVMRESSVWRGFSRFFFTIRTWTRRTIWGDRLFLHFQGPTTILIQTRASRLSDVLSSQDVAEIADAPAGMVQSAVSSSTGAIAQGTKSAGIEPPKPLKVNFATVKPDGKVTFDKEASSTV